MNLATPGGEMIGTYDGTQRRYFLKDHLGSIRATVDASGNMDGYDDFYAFGLTMPGRSSNTGNPNDNYKYTGHEFDNEANLNLYYAGARYMDPMLGGRWLSVDPLAREYPGISPYAYGLNNPVSNYDPDGRFVLSFLSGFARGIFSGQRIGESFNQGVGAVRNWAGIWSSFGRGNTRQIISKFTWELPQQLIGVLAGTATNVAGGVESISHKNGATLINQSLFNRGAFTMGSIIQSPVGFNFDDPLIRHEYGHYLQSQRIGPGYLGVAALSWGSFLTDEFISRKHDHSNFKTETWADKLSREFFNRESSIDYEEIKKRSEELLKDNRLDGECAAFRCKEDDFYDSNQD